MHVLEFQLQHWGYHFVLSNMLHDPVPVQNELAEKDQKACVIFNRMIK